METTQTSEVRVTVLDYLKRHRSKKKKRARKLFVIVVLTLWPLCELNTCRQQQGAWRIAQIFFPSCESRCWKEKRWIFFSSFSCTPFFFSPLLISSSCVEGTAGWFKIGIVGGGGGGSGDDTLLTLLALILMPRARGLYTIHFNAISSCQEGWVIQWGHNCILKFLHWFIPGM